MRLQSIKLAGFKSFAETATLRLAGQMVGVVGPNGCGKSNIMDAIRWVLGESKASELRGESMQDVIFNGSNSRRAANRASVELVFENHQQRAGGQWNQYPEIAVKRLLSREGTSSYYINQQQVRRKDVQDAFLGTGLGPRAYAMIGQGTVSRIIESRPEDLRLYLEEAAGVSKYKERRKETEARLVDTRNNLNRIDDILRELHDNFSKIEKQAEVATRYTHLQESLHLAQQQNWLLKQQKTERDLATAQANGQEAIQALQTKLAQAQSEQDNAERLRQKHHEANETLVHAQGQLYQASAQVSKCEAKLQFEQENHQRLKKRIDTLSQQIAQWQSTAQQTSQNLNLISDDDQKTTQQHAWLEEQISEQQLALDDLQQAWQTAQNAAQQLREQTRQTQQQLQLLSIEQRNLHAQQKQAEQRKQRLAEQGQNLQKIDAKQLTQLQDQLTLAQDQSELQLAKLHEQEASLPALEQQRSERQNTLHSLKTQIASAQAQLQTLSALQQKLQNNSALSNWLTQHELQHLQPIMKNLTVDKGWSAAFEAALRERLQALPSTNLPDLAGFSTNQKLPPAKLSFYARSASHITQQTPKANTSSASDSETHANANNIDTANNIAAHTTYRQLPLLLTHLQCQDPDTTHSMRDWLHNCYCANDLKEALSARHQLTTGGKIYLKDGHCVSHNSISFYYPDHEQDGILSRAHDIDALKQQCQTLQNKIQLAQHAQQTTEHTWQHTRQLLLSLRNESDQSKNKAHQLHIQFTQLAQQQLQAQATQQQLDADSAEITSQLTNLAEHEEQNQARFEELDAQLAELQEQHMQSEDYAQQTDHDLNRAKQQLTQLERQQQTAQFQQQHLVNRRQELQRNLFTADEQQQALKAELQQAQTELAAKNTNTIGTELDEVRAAQAQCEQLLKEARQNYDDLGLALRSIDENRMQTQQQLEPLRQLITELRLQEQEAQLTWQQFEDALNKHASDKTAVHQTLIEKPKSIDELQAHIDLTQRQINALGAVNLAAMEELSQVRQRQEYLQNQANDLTSAMQTLQNAIRVIDAQTREQLKNTFDSVNEHFSLIFPELFGGGKALLVMTGDEILDAGVQVMAQPPGKRNQTIRLLSGGEKALTAIALIFAIFQLNPAPFCVLDEVDAPLDDANTIRYAQLIKRMSEKTQFLYISHNKIAMQMAQQLVGVTMQEKGISRLVSVDIQKAIDLATE